MNYKNAKDILPKELFSILQKHAAGQLLYVPHTEESRSGWGEKSGTKYELKQRNSEIAAAFYSGKSIDEVADKFCLSSDSIRKIIYQKKY